MFPKPVKRDLPCVCGGLFHITETTEFDTNFDPFLASKSSFSSETTIHFEHEGNPRDACLTWKTVITNAIEQEHKLRIEAALQGMNENLSRILHGL